MLMPLMRRAEFVPVDVESGRVKLLLFSGEGVLSLSLLLRCTATLCSVLQRFCMFYCYRGDSAFLGCKH